MAVDGVRWRLRRRPRNFEQGDVEWPRAHNALFFCIETPLAKRFNERKRQSASSSFRSFSAHFPLSASGIPSIHLFGLCLVFAAYIAFFLRRNPSGTRLLEFRHANTSRTRILVSDASVWRCSFLLSSVGTGDVASGSFRWRRTPFSFHHSNFNELAAIACTAVAPFQKQVPRSTTRVARHVTATWGVVAVVVRCLAR
jgi:hypothetical protein